MKQGCEQTKTTRNTKVHDTNDERGDIELPEGGGEDEEWKEWSLVFIDGERERDKIEDVRKIYKNYMFERMRG